ncbi:hypothetical protein QMZ05_20515 [Bradyrhizobium sp. INPA03-11B]|uniref:hypothetical protein n=1 Tax=Bradyrhizobium sp. INPA03-11B TaxID=418598 RepID=UPI00338F7272
MEKSAIRNGRHVGEAGGGDRPLDRCLTLERSSFSITTPLDLVPDWRGIKFSIGAFARVPFSTILASTLYVIPIWCLIGEAQSIVDLEKVMRTGWNRRSDGSGWGSLSRPVKMDRGSTTTSLAVYAGGTRVPESVFAPFVTDDYAKTWKTN